MLRLPLGLNSIYSLCFVWIFMFEGRRRRGLPSQILKSLISSDRGIFDVKRPCWNTFISQGDHAIIISKPYIMSEVWTVVTSKQCNIPVIAIFSIFYMYKERRSTGLYKNYHYTILYKVIIFNKFITTASCIAWFYTRSIDTQVWNICLHIHLYMKFSPHNLWTKLCYKWNF